MTPTVAAAPTIFAVLEDFAFGFAVRVGFFVLLSPAAPEVEDVVPAAEAVRGDVAAFLAAVFFPAAGFGFAPSEGAAVAALVVVRGAAFFLLLVPAEGAFLLAINLSHRCFTLQQL